jgi:hypothetical protein
MNSGSVLEVGGSGPGTMTFLGNLTLASGSTTILQVFSTNSCDILRGAATNTLSANGTVLLDFTSDISVEAGDRFYVADLFQNWSNVVQGAGLEFAATGLPGSFSMDSSTVASNGMVSIVPVQVDPFILPDEFPIAMTYHGPVTGTNSISDELLKYENIEILGSVANGVWDDVRSTFPDKMVLKQSAWGSDIETSDKLSIFPGHLLLKTGTKLAASASAGDTVLYVDDYRKIAANQAVIDQDNASGKPLYLLIYKLDENNEPDWSQTEHVIVTAINPDHSFVVTRAQFGGAPLALEAGKAVLAKHMMFWSGQWQLNFSLQCPRGGPLNLTAAEWFAREIKRVIDDSGADGIEFDVARWGYGSLGNNTMDCNNDLVNDYGYIDGVQSFGLGGQVFVRELRKLLGPGKIIQMDSNGPGMQRGRKYVNGVQLESFPEANNYDQFSPAFLHFRRWTEEAESLPKFSYGYIKTVTTTFANMLDTDGSNLDWHFRVGFASDLLLGMPSPFTSITDPDFIPDEDVNTNAVPGESDGAIFKWDEYTGGELDDWKWLGRAAGPAVQVLDDLAGSNLLDQAVWSWTVDPAFTAACSVSNGEYSTEISSLAAVTSIPPSTIGGVTYYAGTSVPKTLTYGVRLGMESGAPSLETNQEYTIEFEATGNDDWDVAGQTFDQVPRMLSITGPQDSELQMLVDSTWRTVRLSFFATGSAPLVFGFSEQIGSAAIRNIRLYKGGCERWMREFEHGRVYLNMTRTPWAVDVGSEAVQRLLGTQNPDINNGQVVSGKLTVPSWDAVFLRTDTFDTWQADHFGGAVFDDFSTGFDGRSAGDSLVGFPVQSGSGSWTNNRTDGSGTLGGDLVFFSGGVTETVDEGGGIYVPLDQPEEVLVLEIEMTLNDFSSAGNFSMGFLETINSGYFQNNNSDDALKIRYIQSGVNAGRFQFSVYNEGVAVNSTYSALTGAAPAPGDTIRLTLSYDADSGDISGTACNVTAGQEISSKTIHVPGLSNMDHIGFGWSGIIDQTATPSATPGIVSSFKAGDSRLVQDASLGDASADPDGDGATNFEEYVAGSDPLDGTSLFALGEHIADNTVQLSWSAASNRIYDVYWSTNLIAGFQLLETGIAWPQAVYTHIPDPNKHAGFYKIQVRKP